MQNREIPKLMYAKTYREILTQKKNDLYSVWTQNIMLSNYVISNEYKILAWKRKQKLHDLHKTMI